MFIERLFVWPVIFVSYCVLATTVLHVISGEWLGVTSVGLLFAIPVGVPVLFGYAGSLWRKDLLVGAVRWEALICAIYPILLLMVAGAFIVTGQAS